MKMWQEHYLRREHRQLPAPELWPLLRPVRQQSMQPQMYPEVIILRMTRQEIGIVDIAEKLFVVGDRRDDRGVLRHYTEMEVKKQCVDSHGPSEVRLLADIGVVQRQCAILGPDLPFGARLQHTTGVLAAAAREHT